MYVCMYGFMYESIYNVPLLQPKQSRVRARRPNQKDVFSLLQNNVSVSIGPRSDGGREVHSFGAQAAKLRGLKLEVQQASNHVSGVQERSTTPFEAQNNIRAHFVQLKS